MRGVEIAGFSSGDRTFGSLRCFPCWISGIEGAVIIPERSHYGFDILEIISPKNLRKALSLNDGDEVKVEALVD
jgi:riboflavin kinase